VAPIPAVFDVLKPHVKSWGVWRTSRWQAYTGRKFEPSP